MINLFEVIKNQPGHFKQLTCKNLLFTQYDCPQVERKESFYNECNYITYVLNGRRLFHSQGQSWEQGEGKSLFVKRGAHIAEKFAGEGWCVMVFFIPDDYLNNFIRENRSALHFKKLPNNNQYNILAIDVDEITKSFFHSMLPYFAQQVLLDSNLLDLKFRELILSILLNPANENLLSYFNDISDSHTKSLKEVMDKNYMFNLSLRQYAELSNRSLATFKRNFVKFYNTTPAKWLKETRLKMASDLLCYSSMSVQNIAYDSGFENTTHFSKVFKQQFGIPPLQYRNRISLLESEN